MLSQHLLSQCIPWEGGARRPKGDGRREGSRGAAKETATPPRPRRAGGEYVFSNRNATGCDERPRDISALSDDH